MQRYPWDGDDNSLRPAGAPEESTQVGPAAAQEPAQRSEKQLAIFRDFGETVQLAELSLRQMELLTCLRHAQVRRCSSNGALYEIHT